MHYVPMRARCYLPIDLLELNYEPIKSKRHCNIRYCRHADCHGMHYSSMIEGDGRTQAYCSRTLISPRDAGNLGRASRSVALFHLVQAPSPHPGHANVRHHKLLRLMQLMISYGPEENRTLIPGLSDTAWFTICSKSALCSISRISIHSSP